MPCRTPVVLLTFNRPTLTQRVWDVVCQLQPETLVIVSDGPRDGNAADSAQVAEVRRIMADVPWPCHVIRDYAAVNMGLRRRVSSGLDSVFAQFERAIILEDDCLPALSFFAFCEELLDRYADDRRVHSICGTNFQRGQQRTPYSYYFSHRHHVWGWATWRRAWSHFDLAMTRWPEFVAQNGMALVTDDDYEASYWTQLFQQTYDGKVETWAYPWAFSCLTQSAYCIRPNRNLITNIGGFVDSTHPGPSARLHDLPLEEIGPLGHPPMVLRHREADMFEFDWGFGGKELRYRFARRTGWRSLAPRIKKFFTGTA